MAKAKAKSNVKSKSKSKLVGPAKKVARPAKQKTAAKKSPALKAKAKGGAKPKKSGSVKSVKAGASKGKAPKAVTKKVAKPAPKTAPAQKSPKTKNVDWSQLISPLDDRVLVQVDENNERRTAGGLYLPETSEVKGNFQGTVVSVGPGHRDKKGRFRPLELKVGDRILFAEWTGTEVQLENESFKILRETEVLGLLD